MWSHDHEHGGVQASSLILYNPEAFDGHGCSISILISSLHMHFSWSVLNILTPGGCCCMYLAYLNTLPPFSHLISNILDTTPVWSCRCNTIHRGWLWWRWYIHRCVDWWRYHSFWLIMSCGPCCWWLSPDILYMYAMPVYTNCPNIHHHMELHELHLHHTHNTHCKTKVGRAHHFVSTTRVTPIAHLVCCWIRLCQGDKVETVPPFCVKIHFLTQIDWKFLSLFCSWDHVQILPFPFPSPSLELLIPVS